MLRGSGFRFRAQVVGSSGSQFDPCTPIDSPVSCTTVGSS